MKYTGSLSDLDDWNAMNVYVGRIGYSDNTKFCVPQNVRNNSQMFNVRLRICTII